MRTLVFCTAKKSSALRSKSERSIGHFTRSERRSEQGERYPSLSARKEKVIRLDGFLLSRQRKCGVRITEVRSCRRSHMVAPVTIPPLLCFSFLDGSSFLFILNSNK